MTTLETAILIEDPEPEEALAAKPASGVPALSARLPEKLRFQRYPSCFREYDNTCEFSSRHSGLLSKKILGQGQTIIGALFLRPCIFESGWVGGARPAELQFLPKLVWFRLRSQGKLERLMLAFAKDVKVEPGRLYFYYQGAQVNPQSTIAQVRRTLLSLMASPALVLIEGVGQLSIPAGGKLDVEVEFDKALEG